MPLLDVQRRGQQVGRIRIGQKVPMADGKFRPAKLDTFRFTTGSRLAAEAIAAQLGGQVKPWERGQWEVITGRSELAVAVPPRDAVVSQWYEMWTAGGCARRCDSQIEQKTGGPCLCPHAEDPTDAAEVEAAALERDRLARLKTPKACKPVTRISLMIPDLPTLGVWRIDTGSIYAAMEIGDAAHLMQLARDSGVILPAMLRIDQRQRIADGKTKNYPVPVLEIMASLREITSGALAAGGLSAQLPPAPGEARLALGPGRPAVASGSSAARPPAPEARITEQSIANQALNAKTADEVRKLFELARAEGLDAAEYVMVDDDNYEELKPLLDRRIAELSRASGAST